MKYLVTGGAGFIGAHVAKALIDRGDEVVIVDNLNDYYDVQLKKDRLSQLLTPGTYTFHQADIADEKAMQVLVDDSFDAICHLAAQAGVRYSLEAPRVYEQSNGMGMLTILELCRKHNLPLVYASSSSVYGANTKTPFSEEDRVDLPMSLYAATKRYNELLAHTYHHLYGVKNCGLRFFTVYGPWGRPDMALFLFAEAMKKNEPIKLFNEGKMERDFTYVRDIVQGILAALDKQLDCEIINLGRGKPVSLLAFVDALESALGKKAKKELLPLQPGDVLATHADISKAKKLLGYEPNTGIEEGVNQFVLWYDAYDRASNQ